MQVERDLSSYAIDNSRYSTCKTLRFISFGSKLPSWQSVMWQPSVGRLIGRASSRCHRAFSLTTRWRKKAKHCTHKVQNFVMFKSLFAKDEAILGAALYGK